MLTAVLMSDVRRMGPANRERGKENGVAKERYGKFEEDIKSDIKAGDLVCQNE
jgi:hypothetical protein